MGKSTDSLEPITLKQTAALILALIFLELSLIGAYLPGRPSSYLIIPALFVAWQYRSMVSIEPEFKAILFGFLAYLVIFTLLSQSIPRSANGVYHVLRGVLFFPIALVFSELARQKGLLFVNLVALLIILGNFAFPQSLIGIHFFSYYENPNNAAVSLIGLLILLTPLIVDEKHSLPNWIISISGFILGGYLLLLTNARGAWAGAAIGILVLIGIWRKIPIWLRIAGGIILLIGLGILLLYFNTKGFLLNNRREIWLGLFHSTIQDHLFLGHGIDTVKFIMQQRGLPTVTAHNIGLEIFVCSGLLGFVWIIALIFWLIRHLVRFSYNRNTLWCMGLLGISAFLVMAQVDMKFFGFRFIATMFFFTGLIYAQRIRGFEIQGTANSAVLKSGRGQGPSAKRAIGRILIMKWSSMGDVAISTAIMQDICNAFPRATIDINTLPPWDALFKKDPRFSRILAIRLHGKGRNLRGTLELLKAIKAGAYDLIVDLQSNDRSRILLSLLHLFFYRVPYRVGNHSKFPYNIAPRSTAGYLHAYQHQRLAMEALGIPVTTPRPVLYIDPKHRANSDELIRAKKLQSGNYAVFLPGCDAEGWLKRWGASNYAALARLLHESQGYQVALIGAQAEQEECSAIEKQVDAPWLVNLCGLTAIQELVPLCEQSTVVVANDTGTAHIASCAAVPIVVLCGITDPRRVKPVGPNVIALQAKLDCINCYKKTCGQQSCMETLLPEAVLQYVLLAQGRLDRAGITSTDTIAQF